MALHPLPLLIKNAKVLKTGVMGGVEINTIHCMNFGSNFLCVYPEFSNFHKAKINHLWVSMHQKDTAGEWWVHGLWTVYMFGNKELTKQREMLFWTQISNNFALFFLSCTEKHFAVVLNRLAL